MGIYRIVNKLSGKSYIGQSIHCGKRFDEHTKGKQLIDQIIQTEGVENFTFELLKKCDTSELSYWEDYYIIKYNTMYPNGYNKRWNCGEEIRKEIRGELENEVESETIEPKYKNLLVLNASFKGERNFIKLTSKQWGVYYWLILNSYQSSNKNQYIIHKTFALSDIRQDLGISDNRTIKAALEILKKNNLIIIEDQIIYIPYPESYTQLSSEMLNFLFDICIAEKISHEVIYLYCILKRLKESFNKQQITFTLRSLVKMLGHNDTDAKAYNLVKRFISLLTDKKLIIISQTSKMNRGGKYIEFTLWDIKEKLDDDLCFNDEDFYVNKKEELKMKNQETKNEQTIHCEEYLNEQNEDFESHLISEEDLKLLKERLAYQWDLLKDKFTAND